MPLDDRYNFAEIETRWQHHWEETGASVTPEDPSKPKYYVLEMYPYPSGEAHMGHVKNYVIGDVVARYRRMRGDAVLHPMGWDSFGLPTEIAAHQRKIDPRVWNAQCVASMKKQLKRLGISYDWDRELDTSSPDYYGWTQWLFLRFLEAGLAYKRKWPVNWCESCSTVLANKQVINGQCERCDSEVEKRDLANWFFAITKYAERLLDDLSLLDNWPDRVKTMQENWIGRSTGVEFDLEVTGTPHKLSVFTTRIDTVFGVTYMVLAPEHPLVTELTAGTKYETAVQEFRRKVQARSDIERTSADTPKEGVFTGAYAVHPMTGEEVPIWIADYVLLEYGTGAIMAVPAHDDRDFAFATQYGLPVREVIAPPEADLAAPRPKLTGAYVAPGLMLNSGSFNGLTSEAAKDALADHLERENVGRRQVNYRLRDWCISRQKYWGAPIPVVTCEGCGLVPVPDDQLPLLLPVGIDFSPGYPPPLARCAEFVNTTCPRCGGPGKRETDVMDTFVFSSWYFLRFASPHHSEAPFDCEAVARWLPVDQYVGGIEHATVHLVYARFFTKVLQDLGMVDFPEPFPSLFTQGMIYKDGAKMSKSKGNVVTPDEICAQYGADTARLFVLFVGPPEQDAEWSAEGVEGSYRFLGRVWRLVGAEEELLKRGLSQAIPGELSSAQRAVRRKAHQTIERVSRDIDQRFHFNTAISAIMELVNELYGFRESWSGQPTPADAAVLTEATDVLLRLLSPFVPHLAEELWHRVGCEGSVCDQPWPDCDPDLAREEEITLVVQVNGKVRERLQVPVGSPEEELRRLALQSPAVEKHLAGKSPVKVIVVPDKLINIVVR